MWPPVPLWRPCPDRTPAARLNLRNAAFLDHTWLLPLYRRHEFVPCHSLGVKFG